MRAFFSAARGRTSGLAAGRGLWLPGAILAALLLALWAGAPGCAKRQWVAAHRAEGTWPPAPSAQGEQGSRAAEAARQRSLEAPEGREAGEDSTAGAPDPVASGGLPLAGTADRVATELPWTEVLDSSLEASPGGQGAAGADEGRGRTAGAAAVDCRSQPCFWVQVAALADSEGASRALARAQRLAAESAGGDTPGSAVLWERGLWKLRLGPYPEWEVAESALQAVRQGGFAEAWLVRP